MKIVSIIGYILLILVYCFPIWALLFVLPIRKWLTGESTDQNHEKMKKNKTDKVKLKVYIRENGESKVNISFIYRSEVESTIQSWRKRATVTGYSVETIEK